LSPHELPSRIGGAASRSAPGYREELRHRPEISNRLAAAGGLMTAEAVAAAILRGIERGRFVIAPGVSMTALVRLHSVAAPILHRFWFGPYR
jgi:hypothetical protein